MATHSGTLAWKIPWTEEPGRLHKVHGVAKGWTWLRDFTFIFHFHALEKEMATHSSILAWRIPGTAETGGWRLPSMGSHRVRHDWSDLAAEEYTHGLYMEPTVEIPARKMSIRTSVRTMDLSGQYSIMKMFWREDLIFSYDFTSKCQEWTLNVNSSAGI